MKVGERTAALLALIEEDRLADRRRVLEEAASAAASRLREAHLLARSRVRKLMVEERTRAVPYLSAARARSQSRLRALHQQQSARSLELARIRLEDVLQRLWGAEGRRQWIGHYASLALNLLPKGDWVVNHPTVWTAEDRRAVEEALMAQGMPAPRYVPDPSIRAGLRFCAGAMKLDATLDGLLADRYEIDGRLLHYLGEAQ